MIKFTGNIHMDMMCSCCTDKTRAKNKINSARTILNNIQRMANKTTLKPFIHTKEHSEYLRKLSNSHNHISVMCGSCRQINKHDLLTVENEINYYLGAFILYIESIDSDKALSFKRDLFNLFRGHYPIAARVIDNIKIEREVF